MLEETRLLVAALDATADDDRRAALVAELRKVDDAAVVAELCRLSSDPSPVVREAVARELPWAFADEPDEVSIRCLIDLSRDDDVDVRDWATFALARLIEDDGPSVVSALVDRLQDRGSGEDIRHQAVLGLALRRDPRARDEVQEMLVDPIGDVTPWLLNAAAALADPALHPLLLDLDVQRLDDEELGPPALDLARRRCDPATAADAASWETAYLAGLVDGLVGPGLSVQLMGHYPWTELVAIGPDGATAERLWFDDDLPQPRRRHLASWIAGKLDELRGAQS